MKMAGQVIVHDDNDSDNDRNVMSAETLSLLQTEGGSTSPAGEHAETNESAVKSS